MPINTCIDIEQSFSMGTVELLVFNAAEVVYEPALFRI